MEFGVLGSVVVWAGGGELALGGGNRRAVLAALLLRPNELVPTATLVEDLWGDDAPLTAVKAVQSHVWALRKVLGKDVVETRAAGYLLRVEPGALDVQRFDDLREQGRRLLADGAAEEAGAVLREALALWRGPALAEFEDAAFARDEARRLEELRIETLELRLEADLELGRTAGVVGELEALVRAHPRRDHLRELLMLALYRGGRQADALAVYQETRAMLVRELGLEPGASLRRLEQAILRRDPSLDPVAAPPTASRIAAQAPEATVETATAQARKTVTVVFCDISTVDVIGEQLDPESLQLVVSRSFDAVSAAVERHGGSVEKFVGDEVMAVFGVPVVREDDALRAVRAAVEIRDGLSGLGVHPRLGVNTGEVLAGGSAAGRGMVTGHPVGVAKRLQEAAGPGEVLIGASTLELVGASAQVEPAATRTTGGTSRTFRLLAVGAVVERPHAMPFVGRRRELAVLREAWERACSERRCELVTVVGDAGIGKSRLAAELAGSLDARVVRGRCIPFGEAITYWPVVELLNQLGVLPADEVAAAAIRSLLDGTETVARAEEIAWAFRKTLEQVAGTRPLMVVIDDAHAGEEAFLDLVEQVALLSSSVAILVICLARPELVGRRPSWPVTLRLPPLGDADVDELIPVRIAREVRERIARAAGGNPLYVEGLVAMARDSDRDIAVPPTLQALLAARIDQLDPSERTLLELGAVEGESFHLAAVQHLAGDDTQLSRRLAALVRTGLINPERLPLTGEDGFRFGHQLIRDAAYGRLPKASRAVLHERFAAWQEEHGSGLVVLDEVVGYHLEQAHRHRTELAPADDDARALAVRAARHLGLAGRRASDRGDVDAAVNLLRRATTLLPAGSLDRLRLLLPYGYAVHQSGKVLEARAIRDELVERATAQGERGLAAHARGWDLVARVFSDPAVDLDEAQTTCEQGIATFTEFGDDAGLAVCLDGLASICRARGREADATGLLERALAHANASDDVATRRLVTQAVTMPLRTGPMPVDEAIRRCEELRASTAGDRVLDAALARVLSSLQAMAGRFDEARESWESASAVLDQANMLTHSWVTQGHAGWAKELAGDRAGAERELRSQWLSFGGTLDGAPNVRAMEAAYGLANFYCDEERWDEAKACLAFHQDVSAPSHVVQAVSRLAAAARVGAHRGELEAATALARRAVELAETTDMPNLRASTWLALAEVQRAAGRSAEGDAAVAAALALYEQKGNVAAAARVRERGVLA